MVETLVGLMVELMVVLWVENSGDQRVERLVGW